MSGEKLNLSGKDSSVYDVKAEPVVDIDLSACSVDDRPRMVALINRLAQSPKGKETLELAKECGYSFSFYTGSKNSFGAAYPNKKLRLNSVVSDDKLVGTLCHECRHAAQFSWIKDVDKNHLNFHSRIMFDRAMEADAQVCAAVACEELKRSGDAGPQKKFAEFYPEIYQGFTAALERNNHVLDDRVMTETFKAWYDQRAVKASYEQKRLIDPVNVDLQQLDCGNDPLMHFDKELSARNVVALMARTKNGNYFKDDPSVLETGKFVDISPETHAKLKEYFAERQNETGEKPDASVDRLPIRSTAAQKTAPVKPVIQASSLIMAKFKRNGR